MNHLIFLRFTPSSFLSLTDTEGISNLKFWGWQWNETTLLIFIFFLSCKSGVRLYSSLQVISQQGGGKLHKSKVGEEGGERREGEKVEKEGMDLLQLMA